MNLAEMRLYVRETLESDNDEFSDFLIDQWLREGWLEAHRYEDWPFLDTTWTLATASASTDFGQIRDENGAVPQTIRSVRSSNGLLSWLNPDEAQNLIAFETNDAPRYWAVRGGRTLLLAPAASESDMYVIQGYRGPVEWLTEGDQSVPDLPEDLHVALAYYALGRAFQRLDDAASAIHHLDLYNAVLLSTSRDTVSSQFGGSLQIGGGHGVRDRDINTGRVGRFGRFSNPNFRIQ